MLACTLDAERSGVRDRTPPVLSAPGQDTVGKGLGLGLGLGFGSFSATTHRSRSTCRCRACARSLRWLAPARRPLGPLAPVRPLMPTCWRAAAPVGWQGVHGSCARLRWSSANRPARGGQQTGPRNIQDMQGPCSCTVACFVAEITTYIHATLLIARLPSRESGKAQGEAQVEKAPIARRQPSRAPWPVGGPGLGIG